MTSSIPRRAAAELLLRVEKEVVFADQLIDQECGQGDSFRDPTGGSSPRVVYGVLRRQGTLDHIIGQFSKLPPGQLEPSVRVLLRTGLYQLFFLDRVPVSAAVNETVNVAAALTPGPRGSSMPSRAADRGRDTIAYPDREHDPAGFLAARYSHPRWLVEEWAPSSARPRRRHVRQPCRNSLPSPPGSTP